MIDSSNDLNPEVLFWISKLLDAFRTKIYEMELGSEFVNKFGEKFIDYAKNSSEEYQKELQKVHNKLREADRKTLDDLLLNIDDSIPCKEETCLNPYEWSRIYQYIYRNHFKTTIIRSINKHLEGLDPTQPIYDKEIKNIRDVLMTLSEPEVYKILFAAYMLTEYKSLKDILSTPENSSINDKMFEQIRYLKASNDIQNYNRAIHNYIQKQIEWIDLAYQEASKYIENIIEELFHNNAERFVEKIVSTLLKYSENIS